MQSDKRQYIAIDLKSFYASVECVERNLDPLDTCLVVADKSRTEKTICLAVSPALKAFGTGGRPRLFEVVQKVREVNRRRGYKEKSISGRELAAHPDYAVDYLIAAPRMSLYVKYSTRIYNIYLRHIAPEDIHVYSIDEVFIDATEYLRTYHMSAHDLAMMLIREVLGETGITATAGIGTNLYLCKIAMDIVAKKMPPDKDGVRIAELDEISYRHELWDHMPLTDFWRIGRGVANRLARYGIYTMGDIALQSVRNDNFFYREFGVNAELLIDHAWGWEPVSMEMIKSYRPETRSISSGQVLTEPYPSEKAKTVTLEMTDAASLELVEHGLLTDQMMLTIGYDVENITHTGIDRHYQGRIHIDHYGRQVPQHSQGIVTLSRHTSASFILMKNIAELYDSIVNPDLLIRRITISFNRLVWNSEVPLVPEAVQFDLFTDYDEQCRQQLADATELVKEHRRQETLLHIKKQFGKNAILRGLNYVEGATQRERNQQIGGHRE